MADLGEWDFGSLAMDANGIDGRAVSVDEMLQYTSDPGIYDMGSVQVPQTINPAAQSWGDVAKRGISVAIDSIHQAVSPYRGYVVNGRNPYQQRQGVLTQQGYPATGGYVANDQVLKTLLMAGVFWYVMR